MIAIIIFVIASFINSTTTIDDVQIDFSYYEYHDVRDSSNNYFNLRVTYDLCDTINNSNESRFMCKQRAYERAISIDA